ncbi:MAG: NERD domain-containing protein [Planctomycetes bacterium]|jgi:hypothetical protein|nr:NERD domain-containing protein [Planctomycetota bacterium]
MALVFWEGAPFSTLHEAEAEARLSRELSAVLSDSPTEIHVAFSFHLPGAQVDVAVLGPGGIVVGEIEEWPGLVHGDLNGPWTVALPDGSAFIVGHRENPYAQCRRILHVGVSRARDQLYVSAPDHLSNRGRGLSRFLPIMEPAMEVRDLR